jgi:cytochrome c peroxidase
MKKLTLPLLLATVAMIFFRCDPFEKMNAVETKLELPDTPFSYNVSGTNDHLPTLGRVLFYDPRMSLNNSVSCASCHKQSLAFSDNAKFSRGFENKITTRNSMPIQNIISNTFGVNFAPDKKDTLIVIVPSPQGSYMPGVPLPVVMTEQGPAIPPTSLFWDGRESELEVMVTKPIMNHIEMGVHDLETLATKLSAIPEYKTLFAKAFGKEEFTSRNISLGLSAFLLSIRSTQSKFDKSVLPIRSSSFINIDHQQLSATEELGRQLFFNKFNCNTCHEANGFADIGLDGVLKDQGMSSVTGNPKDAGKFKIPSLRNVELTRPYMHDGRFKTLEEVIDHYSNGIANSANLDSRLKGADGRAKQMNISALEKKSIVAFLNTLTDREMISDPKLSNPFKAK